MKPIQNRRQRRGIAAPWTQSGAAAVEFALIFPMMLAVGYASVVYPYVYFLQQSMNFAAQQAVQAAVAVVPTNSASTDSGNRLTQANLVSTSLLQWLPAAQLSLITKTAPGTCPGTANPGNTPTFAYQINLALSGGAGGSLFPTLINLPGIGNVPPLPATLTACAVAFT
jgi:Flp pilus assembly protein TadG